MANLRLQSTLKHKVNKISKDLKCQSSISFIRLMLQEVFELNEIDIDESITDGSMDKGIDAVFEQENEDGENILYIVQSKYFGNPDKSLDGATINKAILAISNYVFGDSPTDKMNTKLRKRAEIYQDRLSNGEIDMISLVFITNGQKIHPNLKAELEQFKNEQNGQLKYEIYTEENLSLIFTPLSAKPVKQIDLKIIKDVGGGEKTFINLPDIDSAQGKVAKVDVYDLAEIIKKNNPNIFHSNVRAFQSMRNKVNESIAKTLLNEETAKQFIYLNNGITLLCDNFNIKPGNEMVQIDNLAIINGCQTASTILEIYNQDAIIPNTAFVLLRIIKSKDEDIKRKIIISSNTQTGVKNRDLISEDQIQKELEAHFLTFGYYYERKKGLHAGKPREKIIDLEKAAQYYLSLYLQKPAEAKNKKSEIYKSYRDQIFSEDLTANQLLVGYILFEKINEKIKLLRKTANETRKSILGNSLLHLLPLFREWAIEDSGKFLSELEDDFKIINFLFNQKIDDVISKMEKAVKKISEKEKDKFNPQYFFKNSDSLKRILKKTKSKIKKTKDFLELNFDNFTRQKDLRYYKPDEYSFDGVKYKGITYWNDLFIKLMELYNKNNELTDGNINFIDIGTRTLLLLNPDETEKRLRKKMKNGLWLLTNFNSSYLSRFCFAIAEKLEIKLFIRLRPTRFRTQRKYKRRRRKKSQK